MSADPYGRLRERLAIAVQAVCPAWLRQSEEDLVQVGIMAVMRIAAKGEEPERLPASYLRKVAYSAVVDEIRRLRCRKEISLEAIVDTGFAAPAREPVPERVYADRQIAVAVRRCLSRLRQSRKIAVTLHLLGYGRPQIARRLGWNRKRAANLVFRGLENLRECLRAMQVTP